MRDEVKGAVISAVMLDERDSEEVAMRSAVKEAIDSVVCSRSSIRAFIDKPVSDNEVLEILRVASRAPSGTNAQPWRAYVLRGTSRDQLVEKVCRAYDAVIENPSSASDYEEEYNYYPEKWFEPYFGRRRQNGFELYGLLGIAKGDKAAMHAQHRRNFSFFDAPVGIIFTVNRYLGKGSILDYGMFLQNFMLAAKARGLDTCPQAAWNKFGKIVLPHVGADSDEMLLCEMALGYADPKAPENRLVTPREEPRNFTTFLG